MARIEGGSTTTIHKSATPRTEVKSMKSEAEQAEKKTNRANGPADTFEGAPGDKTGASKRNAIIGGTTSTTAASALPEGAAAFKPMSAAALAFANPLGVSSITRPGVHVRCGLENDNFPAALVPYTSQTGRAPDNPETFNDDDRKTASLTCTVAMTDAPADDGNTKQTVVWAEATMLTEARQNLDGTKNTAYDYQRNDQVEFGVQVNTLFPVEGPGNTTVSYGAGGGVQIHGPLGLDQVQDLFHTLPMGGRRLPATAAANHDVLQHNYSGPISPVPVVTGGVAVISEPFASDFLTLSAGAQAKIPLGVGVVTAQANADFTVRPIPDIELSGGVTVRGQYVLGKDLDFFEESAKNNVSAGAHFGVAVGLDSLFKADGMDIDSDRGWKTKIFGVVEFHDLLGPGGFGEGTTYTVGFMVPMGAEPTNDPTK